MKVSTADDVGKLLLRLTLGILMLLHGIAKLLGNTSYIGRMLEGAGLPPYLSYGVYVGEIIGPLLVIVGWYSRIGSLLIAVNMLFAIALAHRADLFQLERSGGWALELQGFFILTAVALMLMGPGRFSIDRR